MAGSSGNGPYGHDRRVVPAVGLGPGGDRHVVGEVQAEAGGGQDRLALGLAARASGSDRTSNGRLMVLTLRRSVTADAPDRDSLRQAGEDTIAGD